MPEFLFVNKNTSSQSLSRGGANEQFVIQSHVQSRRRRRAHPTRNVEPWEHFSTQINLGDEKNAACPEEQQELISQASMFYRPLVPVDGLRPILSCMFPSNNSVDPFYSTVASKDAGTHRLLHYTFSYVAPRTFLAEAFAPASVTDQKLISRHEQVIVKRLRKCAEDEMLMYATMAYGANCLELATGTFWNDKPPEFFIGRTIKAVRTRLSEPNYRIDLGLMMSIYALAITEFWNFDALSWTKHPRRHIVMSHGDVASLEASKYHLKALIHIVRLAGGWDQVDPYIKGSAILADKYLALYAMTPPLIPLTWDPGELSREKRDALGIHTTPLPRLAENLLTTDLPGGTRAIAQDIVDYLQVAHALWSKPDFPADVESWLFMRMQALCYRLSLKDHRSFSSLEHCIRVALLMFLLSTTDYHGSRLGARHLRRHLVVALENLETSGEEVDKSLLFWCACTGAMTPCSSPSREFLLARVAQLSLDLMIEVSADAFAQTLTPYLFLVDRQAKHLDGLINDLGSEIHKLLRIDRMILPFASRPEEDVSNG